MAIEARKAKLFYQFLEVVSRMVIVAFALLVLVAIGLGRLVPPSGDYQEARRNPPVFVPGYLSRTVGATSSIRDPDTHQILETLDEMPAGRYLQATFSPWETGSGESEMIAFCVERSRHFLGPDTVHPRLVRLAWPSLRTLDQVDLPTSDSLPSSGFCWLPGLATRVYFAGMDGSLYICGFQDHESLPGAGLGFSSSQIRRLSWNADRAVAPGARFLDPSSSSDPRLSGLIFSAVLNNEQQVSQAAESTSDFPEVWWIQIDSTGNSVTDAGPLVTLDPINRSEKLLSVRYPVLATGPDGGLLLSYLRHDRGEKNWSLYVGKLELGSKNCLSNARLHSERVLAAGCVPLQPFFSDDGRCLSAVRLDFDGHPYISRFVIDQEFSRDMARTSTPGPLDG